MRENPALDPHAAGHHPAAPQYRMPPGRIIDLDRPAADRGRD
jgi:hypothetical protein